MIHLDYADLIYIAERVVGHDVAVRDAGLLESALARPRASALGVDAYPGLDEKAAALVHSIASNHALIDGNKRLGLAALIAFLGVNGRRLTWSNDEAYDFIIEIASGHLRDVSDIADRIARATDPRNTATA